VHEGNVGVWSENDNVTRFGGLQFKPADDGSHADLGADQTRGE
jgi:N-acetylglucosamine kinase-like BadF-type ATPase